MAKTKKRAVVLISGSGSNLQAIIDASERNDIHVDVVAVISNKDNVKGLTRAENHKIPAFVVDHRLFDSRESFDNKLAEIIDSQDTDIVILAGFMRILTPEFTRKYEGRMVNIHPSLLPKYTGLNTHQRAIDAGDQYHGVTVHFVTAELDGGPAILQAPVTINRDDSADSLAKKVLEKEHIIFPMAIDWLAKGRLTMENNQSILDGKALPTSGFIYE